MSVMLLLQLPLFSLSSSSFFVIKCVSIFFFCVLLLTYIMPPPFPFSIPSPSLNWFLLPAIAIFVEFEPTLLIPWLGLSINFRVSPRWPFTRTPCHDWRSYRTTRVLFVWFFFCCMKCSKREEKRSKSKLLMWWVVEEGSEGVNIKALREGTGSIIEYLNQRELKQTGTHFVRRSVDSKLQLRL